MLSIVPGCKVYFPSAITVIIPETVFSSVDFESQPAKQSIETAAITAAVEDGARLVFTTGGTGLAPRDVTPEATEPLLATRIDGLADAIRRRGEEKIASAALSRGLVGVTARSPEGALVVNAPGSRGGVSDAVAVIGPLAAHIIDQLAGGDHPRA